MVREYFPNFIKMLTLYQKGKKLSLCCMKLFSTDLISLHFEKYGFHLGQAKTVQYLASCCLLPSK